MILVERGLEQDLGSPAQKRSSEACQEDRYRRAVISYFVQTQEQLFNAVRKVTCIAVGRLGLRNVAVIEPLFNDLEEGDADGNKNGVHPSQEGRAVIKALELPMENALCSGISHGILGTDTISL